MRTRIAIGKGAFNKEKMLLSGKLDLNLKNGVIKRIWSVVLYGAQTRTPNKRYET